ncbi:MAG: indolepyruvate ferredoxin oxidoreductase, alpha subunit [Thermodesulfobacteriota bacterium]|nr:indolepyruvate ferredoxin oxidoreductase, alpha subunit [Thermodesulfobacteriota bacterium]
MTQQTTNPSIFLLGNEAIARGIIESGCLVAAAYPGTPSSEVMESLVRWKNSLAHSIYLEWSVNEKVAFETAYGASLAGCRSVAAMKMVGMNVASDSFLSAAYLGIRGGLVVVVADDPGPHSSQTEQDSRFFAWFAKVPVLDPGTPREAKDMAMEAFEISERYEVPVILRPCLRVCHARQNVALGDLKPVVDAGPFKKNWQRWAAIPRFRLVLHKELNEKISQIRANEPSAQPIKVAAHAHARLAVITSGSVSSHVRDIVAPDSEHYPVDVYKVDMPFPANARALQEIVDSYERTLVIEETYPVLELQMEDRRKVKGRLSGEVPEQGELTPEVVDELICRALESAPRSKSVPEIKSRRPSLCAGCPHRSAFFLIRKVFDKAIFTGDIGCYTLGINMGAVDTCLCMGASVGMAGGFAQAPIERDDAKIVATIGDSTFYHAGVPALINAVHTRAPFVLVIMDNSTTAMTGGQPTPAHDFLADGSSGVGVDLERLVRGCGVDFCEVGDPYEYESFQTLLQEADNYTYNEKQGISVIIARRPCIQSPGVNLSPDRFIVGDECDRCMTCIRDLECPAISLVKEQKRVVINWDLCNGCGFCLKMCPSQAIKKGN